MNKKAASELANTIYDNLIQKKLVRKDESAKMAILDIITKKLVPAEAPERTSGVEL